MRNLFVGILLGVVSLFACQTIAPRLVSAESGRRLRKAFEHHQGRELAGVKAYYPQLGGESFVLSERWANYQKAANNCPTVAEVTQVVIGKTTDGGDFVVTLRGPETGTDKQGFEKDVCSLWVVGGELEQPLEVRDFTNY